MGIAAQKKNYDTEAVKRARAWFDNKAEPVWEMTELYPPQGSWDVEDYLALDTDRRIEFDNGRLEFLPVPTMTHEEILLFLFDALRAFVNAKKLGRVFFSGIRVYTLGTKYRVPDVVFMRKERAARMKDEAWEGCDIAMEVVSPEDPDRDWKKKRREYAGAGIPEYWIVDPQKQEIAVLSLRGKAYAVHGRFKPGQKADSVLLKGFAVDVREALFGAKE
ncbi:MAG TPA: Uma2 family endonuclease [Planctomycetota bacterium]|nr:Uma2 family endonuclease [Planctomycetota bacterium]